MKKVFVGGSRQISRLNGDIRHRLDELVRRGLCVLVGDANGADKAVQSYLHAVSYPNVRVFCTAGHCRNNVGQWPARTVAAPHKARDFAFFSAKDAAMAEEADAGLMLWDGKSAGTMVNAARLVVVHKPTVVYVAPTKRFFSIQSPQDLRTLLESVPLEVSARLDRYFSEHASEYSQTGLFEGAA